VEKILPTFVSRWCVELRTSVKILPRELFLETMLTF